MKFDRLDKTPVSVGMMTETHLQPHFEMPEVSSDGRKLPDVAIHPQKLIDTFNAGGLNPKVRQQIGAALAAVLSSEQAMSDAGITADNLPEGFKPSDFVAA